MIEDPKKHDLSVTYAVLLYYCYLDLYKYLSSFYCVNIINIQCTDNVSKYKIVF